MSREELVHAYSTGAMDRRAFMRRMVAAGVSAGAALTYAHVMAPEALAEADAHVSVNDFYPEVDVGIRSGSIERVRRTGVVRVRVSLTDAAGVQLQLFAANRGKRTKIGSRKLRMNTGTQVVAVSLNKRGRQILASRQSVQLSVIAIATDLDPGEQSYTDRDASKRRIR